MTSTAWLVNVAYPSTWRSLLNNQDFGELAIGWRWLHNFGFISCFIPYWSLTRASEWRQRWFNSWGRVGIVFINNSDDRQRHCNEENQLEILGKRKEENHSIFRDSRQSCRCSLITFESRSSLDFAAARGNETMKHEIALTNIWWLISYQLRWIFLRIVESFSMSKVCFHLPLIHSSSLLVDEFWNFFRSSLSFSTRTATAAARVRC